MMSGRLARIIDPPPPQRSLLEAQYRRTIRELLQSHNVKGQASSVIFSKMRGVFPGDIVGCHAEKDLITDLRVRETSTDYTPQLHALNYEWYFTKDSALDISREFLGRRGITICLGAPTVAATGLRDNKDLIFIDQNPLALSRFPELRRAAEIHLMDAFEAKRLDLKADTVIFDSPWYLGDTLGWLITAFYLVKPGGTIVFALYPPLVRATSQIERDLILEFASAIGAVDVTEDVLTYQTPLFEREALKACGVRNVGNWRRGDLVVIKDRQLVELPVIDISARGSIDGPWETYVIGSQVIKLRINSNNQGEIQQTFLGKVEESFVLPSVSVNDRRREAIDIWTSENRVAKVANIPILRDMLRQLEAGISMKTAVQPYRDQFVTDIQDEMQAFLLPES